jgi:hypothetical protein
MIAAQHLDSLDPQRMRHALESLLADVAAKDERIQRQEREATFKQAVIDKLTHEVAVLRRQNYAATSEKFRACPAPKFGPVVPRPPGPTPSR